FGPWPYRRTGTRLSANRHSPSRPALSESICALRLLARMFEEVVVAQHQAIVFDALDQDRFLVAEAVVLGDSERAEVVRSDICHEPSDADVAERDPDQQRETTRRDALTPVSRRDVVADCGRFGRYALENEQTHDPLTLDCDKPERSRFGPDSGDAVQLTVDLEERRRTPRLGVFDLIAIERVHLGQPGGIVSAAGPDHELAICHRQILTAATPNGQCARAGRRKRRAQQAQSSGRQSTPDAAWGPRSATPTRRWRTPTEQAPAPCEPFPLITVGKGWSSSSVSCHVVRPLPWSSPSRSRQRGAPPG